MVLMGMGKCRRRDGDEQGKRKRRNKLVNEGNWNFNTNGSSGGSNASQGLGNFMYEPTAAASETLRSLGEDGNEDDENVEIVPPGMLTTAPPSTPTISSTIETPLLPLITLTTVVIIFLSVLLLYSGGRVNRTER
jgi:hypothetical protein